MVDEGAVLGGSSAVADERSGNDLSLSVSSCNDSSIAETLKSIGTTFRVNGISVGLS